MNVDVISQFLDQLMSEVSDLGIDTSPFPLDHIAYQTSSVNDYKKMKQEFTKDGGLIQEAIVGGRRISIIKLNEPIYSHLKLRLTNNTRVKFHLMDIPKTIQLDK